MSVNPPPFWYYLPLFLKLYSTTATHCCSVLLLESLTNYRGLKTTSLALSVSSANVSVSVTEIVTVIVTVIALASDTRTHPVQGRSHHVQGFVNICPAIPQRTVAVSRDDPVTAVH